MDNEKVAVFHAEFVDSLNEAILANCGDGSCITASALAKAVGLSEADAALVREAVSRNFDELVEVRKGPGGGYKLKGVAEKKKAAEVTLDCANLAAEIQGALALTNGKAVPVGYIASRLGLPPDGGKQVVLAVKSGLVGPFEVTSSGGIRAAKPTPTAADSEVSSDEG